MRISLVISTYNWKEALKLCLLSVTRQTLIPTEVVIADDGSRPDTRLLIEDFQRHCPCPIKHVWHEDDGWKKCVIMNKAFAVCEGDYIIEIDGDIIMHSHFIQDHVSEARKGYFLVGSRSKINERLSCQLLQEGNYQLSFFTKGVYRKLNALRLPWITYLFRFYKQNKKERGCNISFWRKDLLEVNGYDERFIGYGFEDIDLPARLRRLGIKKRFIKFKAIEYHIHHKAAATKKDMSANEEIFNGNNQKGIIKCPRGIDQYLNER